jgi:hypothetical protein
MRAVIISNEGDGEDNNYILRKGRKEDKDEENISME